MIANKETAREKWQEIEKDYWSNRSHRQKWAHLYLLAPALLTQINQVHHESILDFGCGDGLLFSILAKEYPNSALYAYDISESMRDHCRKQFGSDRVLDNLDTEAYDVIYANMVIQDIYNLQELMLDLRKNLTSNGVLLVSIPHPIFSLKEKQHVTTRRKIVNPSGHKEFDRYLFEETEQVYWDDCDDAKWTFLFNRTFQTYASIFRTAGFTINDIVEPLPAEDGICEKDLYSMHINTPRFLIFVLSIRRK